LICKRTSSEKALEQEDENERKKKRKGKNGLLGILFSRARSVSRNETVMKSFKNLRLKSTAMSDSKYSRLNRVETNENETSMDANDDDDDNSCVFNQRNCSKESQSGGFWTGESFDIDASVATLPLKSGSGLNIECTNLKQTNDVYLEVLNSSVSDPSDDIKEDDVRKMRIKLKHPTNGYLEVESKSLSEMCDDDDQARRTVRIKESDNAGGKL